MASAQCPMFNVKCRWPSFKWYATAFGSAHLACASRHAKSLAAKACGFTGQHTSKGPAH
jgi:hypothetical protein